MTLSWCGCNIQRRLETLRLTAVGWFVAGSWGKHSDGSIEKTRPLNSSAEGIPSSSTEQSAFRLKAAQRKASTLRAVARYFRYCRTCQHVQLQITLCYGGIRIVLLKANCCSAA